MNKEFLHNQLIKLGDMMGDGLHHEPDGKWIAREYRKVARALGYLPKKKRTKSNLVEIDRRMDQRCKETKCNKCGGELKQTRSGSMRAICLACNSKFQLLRKVKKG